MKKIWWVVIGVVFVALLVLYYPKSYDKAVSWLGIAVDSYKRRDYENASYAFGVASHYIGDSFVAPHYITKEDYKLHDLFESQAITALKSKCKKESYDLNRSLHLGSLNGKDWGLWLKSKDENAPINEAEQSLQLLYLAALDVFNTSCYEGKTEIESFYYIPNSALIFLFIVVGILLVYLILKKI